MDNRLPKRKTIRLKNYDYSKNGAYFFTICTLHRTPLLSRIVASESEIACSELTAAGEIVQSIWNDLPNHNEHISLGPLMIMPDHIHGILFLEGRAGLGPAPTALSELFRQLKSFSSRRCHNLQLIPPGPLWQRGYHEHIIRTAVDLNETLEYIQTNPARWAARQEHPS